MKTLEQIKEEYARELGRDNWYHLIYGLVFWNQENHRNEITKRYTEEYAKEALKNAYLSINSEDVYGKAWGNIKRSVESEDNLPKH